MTAPSLDVLLDAAELHARTILIERQEPLMLMFHLSDAEGSAYIVSGEFTGETPDEVIESKDAVAAFVREVIAEHKIVNYSFMSEAWMIVRQQWTEGVSTAPSDSADRIEVVIATAQDRADYRFRRWRIERDRRGKVVDLVLDVTEGGLLGKQSGRFDGLLEPQ